MKIQEVIDTLAEVQRAMACREGDFAHSDIYFATVQHGDAPFGHLGDAAEQLKKLKQMMIDIDRQREIDRESK